MRGLVGLVLVLLSALPWAFGALLPQRGEVSLGLAALAGWSPYALAVLLAVAGLLRMRATVLVGAVLLVVELATLLPAYVGTEISAASAQGRPVLRVMTANLRFGQGDAATVVRLVREHRVDVLALEELTPQAVQRLEAAGLRAELPYAIDRAEPAAQGTGLWSRLPLTSAPRRALTYQSCAADLVVAGRRVRVRAVHPPPPTDPRLWRHDFALLRAQATDDVGVPTLLLGDFNASVHHRELRQLMGGRWRDAGEVAGAGLVRTWTPSDRLPPLLDPDHVLVDRGMGVIRWAAERVPGSDHRAVLVDVAIGPRTAD